MESTDAKPDARFLGVTATPIRMSGEGFSDLFDVLVNSGELSDFIEQNYLVKVRQIVGITPDLSNVKVKMNDYVQNELGEIMQEEHFLEYIDGQTPIDEDEKADLKIQSIILIHTKMYGKVWKWAGDFVC